MDRIQRLPGSAGEAGFVSGTKQDYLIVVGIGASAGGVEALISLFGSMPCNLGVAFVVVQHLAPNFKSLLPEILARKTEMPVHAIVDGQNLAPNQVFVLPSGKELRVDGRRLYTTRRPSRGVPNKIVDLFFCSLADDIGKDAVGLVLSGSGTDGAEGVAAIHQSGGSVVVQSESSARFFGMPEAAICTGAVDAIVSLEEVPGTIAEIVRCSHGNRSVEDVVADFSP